MNSYRTTIGGIIAAIALILPEIQAMLDGVAETEPNWNLIVGTISALFVALKARDNIVTSEGSGAKAAAKARRKKLTLPCLLPFLLVALVASGCGTIAGLNSVGITRYTETITTVDPETGERLENKFEALGKTRAGMAGQIEGVHDIAMKSGGEDGTELNVGQTASIDNTAQVDVINQMTEAVKSVAGGVTEGVFSFLSANPHVLTGDMLCPNCGFDISDEPPAPDENPSP